MALAKAIALGAIAAIGVPYVMHRGAGETAHWVMTGAIHIERGGLNLYWSWPIFCVVTLAGWLLMKAAGTR